MRVALLFFGGTLAPALGFFNVFPMRYSFVADHFQYLASLGPIVLLCAWATRALEARVRVGVAAGGALVATFGVLTFEPCHVYDGHIALWTGTLRENPDSVIAHANLGKVYLDRGEIDLATSHLERALELDDDWHEIHLNLGVARAYRSRVDEARRHFERVVELKPDHPAGHDNLAWVLNEQGEVDEALVHAERAVALDSLYADGQSTLAGLYSKLGRHDEALRHLAIALKLAPQQPTILLGAASVLKEAGRSVKAIEATVAVLQLSPGNQVARSGLASLLAEATKSLSPAATVQAVVGACRPIPGELGEVLDALADELTRTGRHDAAAAARQRAQVVPR